jgi:hypothetical protein
MNLFDHLYDKAIFDHLMRFMGREIGLDRVVPSEEGNSAGYWKGDWA